MSSTPAGPLAGVRVVELGGIGPAQLGCLLLSDLGADVVLVDRPPSGPQTLASADPRKEVLNRGRRSIALNLKDPDDLAIAWKLIEGADVLVDPYRPGVAERLGVGPDEVLARNPRCVYARMTGWGQDGPMANAAGHDINYIALAGALEPMGEPGSPPPVPLNLIGDFGGGGMLLAFGVVTALLERERSGQGQVVDAAMVDGVASLMNGIFHQRGIGGWNEGRGTNWVQGAAPWYRAYTTSDGAFVTVGSLEGKFYTLLLDKLGIDPAPWPQWDTSVWPGLTQELERVFASETSAHWCALLEGTDACFAPALTVDQAFDHPHNVARKTFIEVEGVMQAAPVPRFGRTPGAVRLPPPIPGEHTEEILAEIGMTVRT
jgi:alpha-methylacyl-CoA racemase